MPDNKLDQISQRRLRRRELLSEWQLSGAHSCVSRATGAAGASLLALRGAWRFVESQQFPQGLAVTKVLMNPDNARFREPLNKRHRTVIVIIADGKHGATETAIGIQTADVDVCLTAR